MLRSMRKLKRLILYKNIKIFEYAVNGVRNCENYKLHLHVNLKKHVHIENLKSEYVYELKYKIVRLEIQRAI